ncbi:hypothetical protein CJ030_MR5G005953 [Morella rubra]|uniref:Uncharacterized protein n=1 Tax=Morella rubra TaxID=262757 RepID=A0A6A1VNH9_9ROSI|nr:hypothetical protein CJ030_MR5G005953 [Morella rubra]
MEPIRAVETQLVNAFPVASAGSVVVSLHNGPVLAQKLEVNFVLRLVALEGGEVNVEVEAAGVTCGALNASAEGAIEEPCGSAPPSPAAVVEGEGDVLELVQWARFWGVVYGVLLVLGGELGQPLVLQKRVGRLREDKTIIRSDLQGREPFFIFNIVDYTWPRQLKDNVIRHRVYNWRHPMCNGITTSWFHGLAHYRGDAGVHRPHCINYTKSHLSLRRQRAR